MEASLHVVAVGLAARWRRYPAVESVQAELARSVSQPWCRAHRCGLCGNDLDFRPQGLDRKRGAGNEAGTATRDHNCLHVRYLLQNLHTQRARACKTGMQASSCGLCESKTEALKGMQAQDKPCSSAKAADAPAMTSG